MRTILLTALLLAAPATAAPFAFSAARIGDDVKSLASDAFAGRGPGEVGEAQTIAFLAARFQAAGLVPAGPNGSWLQPVPLIRLDRVGDAQLSISMGGTALPVALGRNATLALRLPGETAITDAPIVFAGFGVVAAGHDPYQGIDVAGKIVLVLAGDPDGETGADLGFEGRRLVLAGRVGSKFAAAARAGAAGVLVLHEDFAASYPMAQLIGTERVPQMVPGTTQFGGPLRFSSWIEGSLGARLLASIGLDLPSAKAAARKPDFRARPLPATASAAGWLMATPITSYNVVGMLQGSTRPDEAVLFGAHWDANGQGVPDAAGDAIRNGAIDNATGTAELIEVARAFAAGRRPARTLVFAAWTAEEKGLLGADQYAAHPLVPLPSTVAVINLDPHVQLPRTRSLELIGGGRTTLEGDLAAAARAMGLVVVAEPNPEAGWYFRSDHFPFAARGVPALAFRAGRDIVAGGTAAGQAMIDDYNLRCYHQPCDQVGSGFTFEAAAQEAEAAWRVGQTVANRSTRPSWIGERKF
ncbi:M28 family peptidase [Sandarakinorhabdus oryzae]|uniref:M28 family peptidase n=1 Tax=Sandarakinorhabdus oryzae TaxID=2675220 RepID=UPI0012E1EDBA|nr:M28 family peptidase [Sandarakinorhabdus oryzae]